MLYQTLLVATLALTVAMAAVGTVAPVVADAQATTGRASIGLLLQGGPASTGVVERAFFAP